MTGTSRVRITTADGLLSAVPLLIGYQPADGDTVMVGLADTGQVVSTVRFDAGFAGSSTHGQMQTILASLRAAGVRSAFLIGYGENATPAVDHIGAQVADWLHVRDTLRVDGNRYWSTQCDNPDCCPPEGRELAAETAASTALRAEAGLTAAPSRQTLADRIAGPEGEHAEAARQAWQQALSQPITAAQGRQAVQDALAATYQGRQLSDDDLTRLAAAMRDLEIRDDAWARMTPDKASEHQALWTAAVRRLPDEAVAAPATLLAWTAWQQGNGALANIALDRALAAQPGYSMATLIDQAVSAGIDPAHAIPPMTPEQAARAYRDRHQAQADHQDQMEAS
jgi:hypothetical protein